MKKCTLLLSFIFILLLSSNLSWAQSEMPYSSEGKPSWTKLMYQQNPDPGIVIEAYEKYYQTNEFVKNEDTQFYKRWLVSISRALIDDHLPEDQKIRLRQEQQRYLKKRNNISYRSPNSTWESIGPIDWDHDAVNKSYAPGAAHVYTVEQSLSNSDVLYAGTANAGIWKTTDRGLNWSHLTRDIITGSVTALEIDINDADKVYTEINGGIWKTTNGGMTWTETGDNAFKNIFYNAYDIVGHPDEANTLFLATNKGFFKTSDGGSSWVKKHDGDIRELEIHPTNPDTVYLSLTNGQHTEFYRSYDQGESWLRKVNGWPGIEAVGNVTNFTALNTEQNAADYARFTINPEPGNGANADFTIEMRIKCSSWNSDPAIFSNKNWNSGNNKGFVIAGKTDGETWQFNMGDGGDRMDINGGKIADNEWHHIAIVYDADGTKRVYQDGESIGTSTINLANSTASGLNLAIGQDGNLNYGSGIDIDISEVRFWNTILTKEELQDWQCTSVDNTHPQYASLVHYWKIDEGNGINLIDDKGSNDGIVQGNYSWSNNNEMECLKYELENDEDQKRVELAVSDDSPNMIFALATGNANGGSGLYGMYKSSDFGDTWTFECCGPQPAGPPSANNKNLMGWSDQGLDDGGQYYYDLAFDVSPTDADSIFVGAVNLWVSDDGGSDFVCPSKWSHSDKPNYVHADIHDIHYYAATNEIWLAGDGGIFYSNDGGANFERRIFGISGSDFWGFGAGYWDGDVMLGGAYHNGTLLKDNDVFINGWICTDGGDGVRGYVNPGRDKYVFSDYNMKQLSGDRTVGYKTFAFNNKPNASYTIGRTFRLLFHPNYYDSWYTGVGHELHITENNGGSYELVHDFGEDVVASALSDSDPDYIYVTTFSSWWGTKHIYRSSDAGANWTDITPTSAFLGGTTWVPYDITIDPEDPQKIWIVRTSMYGSTNLNGRMVYSSADGGTTWTNETTADLDGEAPTNLVYQKGTDGGIYIATRRAVYYKNNQQANWQLFSNELPASANSTRLVPYYRKSKLRNATNQSVWEVNMYEDSDPIAQPSVDKYQAICVKDTFYYVDHSVLNENGAIWSWSFPGGTPSTSSSRTPKVIYEMSGKYDVSLTVTDVNGTSSKTIENMVEVGTACDPDKFAGKTLSCAQNSDHCRIPDFNLNTNTMTVTAWVKPDGIQNDYSGIFFNDGTSAGLNLRGGNNTLGYHWPGGQWWWNSGLIVEANEWSYVAMVVSPTKMTVYVNGEAAVHNANLSMVQFEQCRIGRYKDWSSRNFKGEIDEVAIWDRSLSQDEIRELRHLTKKPDDFPNLITYYQFNNETSRIPDKAGGFHGLLNGGATLIESSAPVGHGESQRKTISGAGIVDFDETGMKIGFSATHPDGETVVSRLEVLPNEMPDANTVLPNGYWIFNNYGNNQSFSELDEMSFYDFFVSDEMSLQADTKYSLFKRSDNEHMDNWNLITDNNITVTAGMDGEIKYNSTASVTNSGQFAISRKPFVEDTAYVTISTIANSDYLIEGGNAIALHLEGENQGLKLPILTLDEIEELKSPMAGLMVYNSETDTICYFNGTDWLAINLKELSELNADNPSASNSTSVGEIQDPSAVLYLRDHEGGVLLNQFTDALSTSINSPIKGMIMYRSDMNKMSMYNGTTWCPFVTSASNIMTNTDLIDYNYDGIGVGQAVKDPNAILDINVTDKVLLIPSQDHLMIPSPVKGLLIYHEGKNALLIYNGETWEMLKLE